MEDVQLRTNLNHSFKVGGIFEFWKSPSKILGGNLLSLEQLKWKAPIG